MTDKTTVLGRLKRRPEFLFVRDGSYAARPHVVIQMRRHPSREIGVKVGFTATKKIGNAVIRHRAQRRLREAAKALLPDFGQDGCDYVFIARASTPSAPYDALLSDCEKALVKLANWRHKTSK